jgi:hypothetical protein
MIVLAALYSVVMGAVVIWGHLVQCLPAGIPDRVTGRTLKFGTRLLGRDSGLA